MVKNIKRIFILFFCIPFFLFSGEFTASVNKNQVHQGESFILNLTLKNASASSAPSLDGLKQSFHIHSQQQSSQTMIVNGHVSASTTWQVSLSPKSEGETIIPPLTIHTSEGILASNPITIRVTQGKSAGSDSSEPGGLTLTTALNKIAPYKNEPLILTVRLTAQSSAANLQIQKFEIEHAIVEEIEKPKIFKTLVNGINVNVVEFRYLLTPLKAGPLIIPPIVLQGAKPLMRQPQRNSFFDDDFDPFFMMQGFTRMEPFTMATKEVVLDVQPAVPGMNPWLPAASLKIEEIWDGSALLKVGEPITRGFKITAEGLSQSQLPSLQDLQSESGNFKIYADKPEMEEEFKNGQIHSFRKEQYTLIPGQSGDLTLPEISIAWWNAAKKEKAVATVPSRTLHILPASVLAENMGASNEEGQGQAKPAASQEVSMQRDPLLYGLLAGLGTLLFAAILWGITLQRKIVRMTEMPAVLDHQKVVGKPEKSEKERKSLKPVLKTKALTKEKKDKNEKLPDLNPT